MSNHCLACNSKLNGKQGVDLGSLPFHYGPHNPLLDRLLKGKHFNAFIETCSICGLTQQVPLSVNMEAVDLVYQSESSNASTPMSESNWGIARAESIFKNTNFIFAPDSVLEVGCQNGYLLYELYLRGARELVGIEPSPQIPYENNGFKADIVQGYFKKNIFNKKQFDTVISLWVLEHVKDPVNFLQSLAWVLQDEGQLIIAIPNAEYQMKIGDPGLFLYEHLSYFTKNSLNNIFQMANLDIVECMDTNGDLYITAKKTQLNLKVHHNQLSTKDPLSQYSIQLNNIINRFREHAIDLKRVGIWGACGTAVNLIKMANLKNYVIFDSDEFKIGGSISGLNGTVFKPTFNNIVEMVDSVCVVPIGAQEVICKVLKEEYNVPYFRLF